MVQMHENVDNRQHYNTGQLQHAASPRSNLMRCMPQRVHDKWHGPNLGKHADGKSAYYLSIHRFLSYTSLGVAMDNPLARYPEDFLMEVSTLGGPCHDGDSLGPGCTHGEPGCALCLPF